MDTLVKAIEDIVKAQEELEQELDQTFVLPEGQAKKFLTVSSTCGSS